MWFSLKENVFSRMRAEKGIARHIDVSSIVWTLINNGKSANQIVRLAAILVKKIILQAILRAVKYLLDKF